MKRIGSIFLAFCMLNLSFGCSATKQVSIVQATNLKNKKDFLIIKAQDRLFELHNYKFLDDHLEGDLFPLEKKFTVTIFW